MPVELLEFRTDLGAKLFEPTHDYLQRCLLWGLHPQLLGVFLQCLEPFLPTADTRLRLGRVDIALGITVDQPRHAVRELLHRLLDEGALGLPWRRVKGL